MAPVPLPNVLNNVINLPPPPSQPPTDVDVMTGVKFCETMRLGYGRQDVTARDAASAEIYLYTLMGAKTGVSIRDIITDAVTEAFNENFEAKLAPISAKIDRLSEDIRQVAIITALNHNRIATDGSVLPFVEVPFPDGTRPSLLASPLPLLVSLEVVKDLDHAHLSRYYRLYHPNANAPRSDAARREGILKAIGCSVRI